MESGLSRVNVNEEEKVTFTNRPTVWAEFGRQVMYFTLLMGWIHLTQEQQIALLALISAALALFNWTQVMPTNTIEAAGHDVQKMQADAKANQDKKE